MKTYNVSGIVDVGMYQSLLSPEVALEDADRTEVEDEQLWNHFDVVCYTACVCKRAVIELKELLARLPPEFHIAYVEGSAHIVSPRYYNHLTDRLYFQITANSDMTEEEMQRYLTGFFADDWDAEFGSVYRIYDYLRENMTLENFQKKQEGNDVSSTGMEEQYLRSKDHSQQIHPGQAALPSSQTALE